ncbi:MAG: hypothetical protein ACLTIG_04690 [Roseburia hominis]
MLLNHSRKRKYGRLKEELDNSVKSTTGHQAELEETRERLADAEAELKRYEQLVKKIEREKEEERIKLEKETRKKWIPHQ